MQIKEIKIEGFKSFGKTCQSVNLGNINVIIGANGVGKSNFINFMELLAYVANDRLGEYVAENGFADAIMHFGVKNTESVSGVLIFEDNGKQRKYGLELGKGANGELFFKKESLGKDDGSEEIFEYFGKKGVLSEDVKGGDEGLKRIIREYLQGCRVYHFNDTSITAKIRQPVSMWDYKYLRNDGGNIAAFLHHIRYEENLKKYYDRIVHLVQEVFPRFGDFELDLPGAGTDVRLSLTWHERGNDVVFGPNAFSDGTLRFVALTTLLMQPPEYLPKVIILDEPEIGLHPNAVKILADMIRMASAYSQIIVATQSLELLNEFEPEDIIIADYDENRKTSALKRLDLNTLEQWLDDYSLGELWEKSVLGAMP